MGALCRHIRASIQCLLGQFIAEFQMGAMGFIHEQQHIAAMHKVSHSRKVDGYAVIGGIDEQQGFCLRMVIRRRHDIL